jgi:hypothetical protein
LIHTINLSLRPLRQIQVLWGTSCPVSPSEEAIAQPNSSRQYNQLPEVRFSQQPNNKITAATLFRFTDVGVISLNPAKRTPFSLYLTIFSYLRQLLPRQPQPVTYSSSPHPAHQKA